MTDQTTDPAPRTAAELRDWFRRGIPTEHDAWLMSLTALASAERREAELRAELAGLRQLCADHLEARTQLTAETVAQAARIAGLEDRRARVDARVAAMVKWLDQNQNDVWRRGIWDAINAADAALATEAKKP